ncbi:SET and MYND domain-containing protein 4 isoform X2 [Anoplolepis gracilipes]|uniref:SET and MYND domain-containing protein 4 isoform X2 n=1 Tax=Anoplolepis gracilipes TaxID=354296 RepID=UPI003BA2F7E6
MDKIMEILNARIVAENKHQELTDRYKKLKTDQERVIFTLNVMPEYDLVPSTTCAPKNAKESEKLREQGLHSECIQDIDRTLALNYPDDLRAKLYVRKTECLIILRSSSVEEILKEAQHWLDKMSLNNENQKKLQSKLDILHKTVQTEQSVKDNLTRTEVKKPENEPPLPTIASYNDEVPCASDAVAVKYSTHYGRHVIATRNICPGEVIAVEKPYTLLLTQHNMQTHCSNCLKVCWANIPCNYCTYAMYCSEECRYAEWKKCHDIECAVFPALIEYEYYNLDLLSVRLAVLALREAGGMKELRTMLEKLDKCDDPRTKGFSDDGKLHSDKYISVYSLVTNTEKRPVADLFRRSLDTCFILYFLATRTVIFDAKLPEDLRLLAKNDDVTFFGSLILRHQQIIPSNMHSFGEEQGMEHVERGIAAMPFFSLINHSCDGNVLRHPRSKHIVMYAMYPIRKGEQIFDNYGQYFALMPRVMRQQKLFKQYFFTCYCVPCQENWPLYTELLSFKTLVKKAEDKAKIKKALRKFNMYVDLATESNVQDKPHIIEDLLNMVKVLHNYAPMPCKEMNNVIETLKRVYNLNGNRFEIPQIWTHQK